MKEDSYRQVRDLIPYTRTGKYVTINPDHVLGHCKISDIEEEKQKKISLFTQKELSKRMDVKTKTEEKEVPEGSHDFQKSSSSLYSTQMGHFK